MRPLTAAGLIAMAAFLLMTGPAPAHPLGAVSLFDGRSSFYDIDKRKVSAFRAAATVDTPNKPRSFAPCVNGTAAGYACENVDLMSFLPLEDVGGGAIANDIWGWEDPQTGRSYAIMGRTNGTAFVDITDPKRPVYVGNLPSQTFTPNRIFWRDIKVFNNHAFIVAEHLNHGMQVFDLTRLRDVEDAPEDFAADAVYTGFGNAHNVFINEDSGFAYAVGSNTCSGGPHIVDVSDPQNPEFEACLADDGYTHDVQCVIYDGPDTRFTGREICFASNEDTLTIFDVTDKSSPEMLSRTGYPTAAYTHQGWLTHDGRFFLFNDELDELFGTVPRQTTYILDVTSLTGPPPPVLSMNRTPSTDHNLYIEKRWIYESNYQSGLQIFDLRSVPSGQLREVAYFDVYPPNDDPGFDGTWSNYPFYKKGIVAVSGIDSGLFVLRPRIGPR